MEDNVLYLEADEEITAAIDKMLKAKGESVKIVVPKRSTLLQSIVNLKLLKKAADDAGKDLILVTGDRTATHLAGRVGLQVASTLKSAPAVPEVAAEAEMGDIVEAEAAENPLEASDPEPVTPSAPVAGPKPSYAKPMMVRTAVGDPGNAPRSAVDKKKRVPDFSTLQKRLLIGGGVVVLLIALYILNLFLTTANVTLFATGKQINADFTFTVDPALSKTDQANAVLAGQTLSATKNLTATATGTGKKDAGTPATGTITATNNCFNSSASTIPAGTVFTAQGLNFTSTQAVSIPGANPGSSHGQPTCPSPTTAPIPVQANANGDNYNLAATSYSSPGFSSSSFSVTFAGGQMVGGTTKNVTVIQQSDIDAAVTAALAGDKSAEQKDLENKASSSQKKLSATFSVTTGSISSSPAVGAEGSTAAVTIPVTYTELTVSNADFTTLVQTQEQKQVTDQNQLYDTGIDSATLTAKAVDAGGRHPFEFTTNAYAGAKVDAVAAAKALRGKRYGDAADIASQLPGVDSAQISLSPGWATSLPSMVSHIHITIKVAPKAN